MDREDRTNYWDFVPFTDKLLATMSFVEQKARMGFPLDSNDESMLYLTEAGLSLGHIRRKER